MPTPLSAGKKPKVTDRRYLRPTEARRLIEAAGKRGRYPFRDRVLVRLVYRHGLRASEAVGMRWSQVDLDAGTLHVARLKGSIDSTHSLDRDELRDLRKLRREVTGLYVFETERGGPLSVDALQYIVREAGRAAQLDVEVHPGHGSPFDGRPRLLGRYSSLRFNSLAASTHPWLLSCASIHNRLEC